MTSTSIELDPIKTKHRAMWALGDYDRVATDVIPELGTVLAAAAVTTPGERVLDVAAGSGNASLPAAAAGGRVTATDLTPELLEIGRQRAGAQGLDLTWQEADAEHLPFGDGEFDVTMSCVGVMFAPFHQPVADELVRVTRPGGRIALINWTPGGFIGQLFATLRPFVPAPPPGATPGPRWGDAEHVRALFGDSVRTLEAHTQHAAGRHVRLRRAVPRLLRRVLRADDRCVPQRRRRPAAHRRAQPGRRGPRRPVRREQWRDGVGIPAGGGAALTAHSDDHAGTVAMATVPA